VSENSNDNAGPYGVLAEFPNGDALTVGIQKAREAGYTVMDAYTPYPVPDAADALGFPKSEMGTVMFIGGLTGACSGFFMQWFLTTRQYPVDVAGRPLFSWPQYVPITFEMMVLTAALTGLFTLLALCGLPQYYHPLFNVPAFERASRDGFFLCIEAEDPQFDLTRTRDFLMSLQPLEVAEVPK
jgi:hypothetical protein